MCEDVENRREDDGQRGQREAVFGAEKSKNHA